MPRTSRPTTPTSDRGFTLIELLVVVALIGLMSVMAIPSVSSYFKISLNSSAREMATTIKEAYNSAVITGKVHRLVWDLKGSDYWVEVGPPTVLLDTAESREKEEERKRFSDDKKEGSSGNSGSFAMATLVTRKKVGLPRGVVFEDIITQQSSDPVTSGQAFTHMFPHGITEQTLIHLVDDSKHHASLVISPIMGRTDVYERRIEPKEAFGK